MHDMDGNPVNNAIMQQFDKQRSRGTEGFGLFDGSHKNMVRASNENKILKWLVRYDSNMIMFHHRNPTSTINVKRAAHPFSTKDYFGDTQYVLIHNGHVSNSQTLRSEHQELGVEYYSELQDGTFNDSESLLWDLALVLEGKKEKLDAFGGIAFVCMKLVKGKLERLYFGRNTNPLNMLREGKALSLSSEGDGDEIESDTLYTYNYNLNRLTSKYFKIKKWNTTVGYTRNYNFGGRGSSATTPSSRTVGSTRTYGLGDTYPVDDFDDDYYDFDSEGNPMFDRGYTSNEYNDMEHYYRERNGSVSRIANKTASKRPTLSIEEIIERAGVLVREYLNICNGEYESAYWMLEADYDFVETYYNANDPESVDDINIIEKALEIINRDPEYVNENSVNKIANTLAGGKSLWVK